jgi:hypothetical protein
MADLNLERNPPHFVAFLAVKLAVAAFDKHLPADLWAEHADDDEPIYRLTHAFVDVVAARNPTDVRTAHANVPGMLWAMHPPHRLLVAKDTYNDRHWWADRFREFPYLDDCAPAPHPQGSFRLYRGAPPERRDGLTWTPDLGLASRYGPIWTVTVPAEAILSTYIDLHTELTAHVVAPEYLADVAPAGAVAAPFEAAQAAWLRERAASAAHGRTDTPA